ncbi:MAG: AbrB/MazE/SpoVT family DNA-binding domain-containing protein [Nanoarchaeota archaeon]
MKRRVVMHGPATLTISLPNSWVRRHNVQKGDELQVEEQGNELRIYLEKERRGEKKVTVDFTGLGEYGINMLLPIFHKLGFDEIDITYGSLEELDLIRKRIQSMLIGFEIIEQSESRCGIRCVSDNDFSEFRQFFRRAFLVLCSFHFFSPPSLPLAAENVNLPS